MKEESSMRWDEIVFEIAKEDHDQQMQKTNDEQRIEDIQERDQATKDQELKFDESNIDQATHESSNGQPIISVDSQADPTIEVTNIDFIFGDHRQWKSEGRYLMVQILHSIIQSSIPPISKSQQQQCPNSTWKSGSIAMSMTNKEISDQPIKQKLVQWIFDLGGQLQNSRSSSIQGGENNADQCSLGQIYGARNPLLF